MKSPQKKSGTRGLISRSQLNVNLAIVYLASMVSFSINKGRETEINLAIDLVNRLGKHVQSGEDLVVHYSKVHCWRFSFESERGLAWFTLKSSYKGVQTLKNLGKDIFWQSFKSLRSDL